ncbi:MAG: trk system potassium uptake protein TrkA [Erysipelotrichaceae bacterium]|nr:MAG: trk system potassium uptake protein [Erysipelotrichaceae bacterium]TXT17400.1 MAG: trk system potassium uptake protein TrkA [Erysipelotrichaceae bacterium]
MKQKTYAILGLGIFGSTIAKTLSEYHCEVIGIDTDMSCVERVSEFATQAVQADFTDIEQLRELGVQDVDVAVIAAGSRLESSIMAVLHLKELGVPYIVAKAKNKIYMQILLKIGADKVIRPEKEMGERVAKTLLSRNVVDMIDIDDDYSIMELAAPKDWVGSALKNLDVRNKFGLNILGVRNGDHAKLNFSINGDYIVKSEDQLLVIVEANKFEAMEYQGKL